MRLREQSVQARRVVAPYKENTKKPRRMAGLLGVCCVCFRREKSHRVLPLC